METIDLKAAKRVLEAFSVQKVVSIINRYKNTGIDDSWLQRLYVKTLLAASPEPMRALDRAEMLVNIGAVASKMFIEYFDTPLESTAKALSNEINNYIIDFASAFYKCEDKTPFNV